MLFSEIYIQKRVCLKRKEFFTQLDKKESEMAKKRDYKFIEEVPDEIIKKVGKYITNPLGTTFAIHDLPSELTGGVLARYSRAPTGLVLTLVNEFLDENGDPSQEKGTELMDRVLNAFGDDSVGELEGTAVGMEDVSQLLTKYIEDRRIGGSPIEQSTRYVKYDQKDKDGKWRFLRPKEIAESGLLPEFERINNRAFEIYSEGIKRLSKHFEGEFPKEKFEIKIERDGKSVSAKEKDLINDDERRAFRNGYNFTIRCAALDVGRCVLPSSTLTHLGLGQASNGRFYTNLITFLKSQDLEESRIRGQQLEEELQKVIPTYVKRNREISEYATINRNMRNLSAELFKDITPRDDRVTLVRRGEYIDEVVSSALFPYSKISLQQILDVVELLPEEKKLDILNAYKGKRETRRDRTGRGLEAGYPLVFDLVGGFAEYRDLERHRMLTQLRQMLSVDLGFIMPPEMGIIGLESETKEIVDMMSSLYHDVKNMSSDEVAQYTTLFNHRMRFMLGMNLREFQHLSELRTQPAGHFSYRGMVMEMAEKVKEREPWTKTFYEFVDYSDPGNKISRAKEQSKIAGKNLASGIDGGIDL